MDQVFKTPAFKKFHGAYWLLAGTALFISGLTQGPFFVSLTRNVYFTLVGLVLTLVLASVWQKIPNGKIRNSLIGFLATCYGLGMVLTVPINPITFGQLGLPFDEITFRHIFAGSMNFGLVLLFWAVLYIFLFRKQVSLFLPSARGANQTKQAISIEVEKNSETLLIPAHKISHLSAAADYVEIHLLDKKTHLKRVTIQSMANHLGPQGFTQIHRSIIINQRALSGVEGVSKGSYTLIMNTGARLQTSRRYKPAVEALLKEMGLTTS